MKKIKLLFSLFIFCSFISLSQNAASWTADVSHSNVGFKVSHKAISNTIGDFRDFELTMTTPNDNFEGADIKMVIETARVENKKREEANKEPEIIEVKYYDTDEYIDREARKLAKEWGYDEPPEGNFIRM